MVLGSKMPRIQNTGLRERDIVFILIPGCQDNPFTGVNTCFALFCVRHGLSKQVGHKFPSQ